MTIVMNINCIRKIFKFLKQIDKASSDNKHSLKYGYFDAIYYLIQSLAMFLDKGVYSTFLVICFAISVSSTSSYAGIEKLIKNITPKGTLSNISRSGIIKDQLSGHLIGGSVIVKSPANPDLQLLNVTPPSCKIGGLPCAAQFDLRGGALSYINAKEMMEFMKNLTKSAGVYVGLMAVKTICPHCEDIMTWAEAVARNVSSIANMNCNDMVNKIGGFAASQGLIGEANRQSNLVTTGGGRDMTDIATKAKKDSDADPTKTNEKLKNQLGENFNLVWKALDKKSNKSEDAVSLKQLLMSISGTVVIQKDMPAKAYVSLVTDDLIEQYIGVKTGQADINLYECDENENCLSPAIKLTKLKAEDTLYGKLDKLIASMIEKIKKNKGTFSEEEQNLIALSSTPLINKIEMDLASYADSADVTLRSSEFIAHLCYDVATKYLTKMLNQTNAAVFELKAMQIGDNGIFQTFTNQTNNVLHMLSDAKHIAFKRYDLINQTKMRLRQDEKYFQMKFEEFITSNYGE